MANWQTIARRIRVPLGFALAVLYVWLARPTALSLLMGEFLVLPGLLIRALASGHVKKNEELTTTGPYAYTRNPLYLGSLVLAVGFAVAARSLWIAAVMVVFFLVVYVPVIRSEEAFLRGKFPQFEAYCQAVPRLLPRLTAYDKSGGGFALELYRKHREYNALLGALTITAILVVKLVWR
ncbi:MAG: isoprenylcysteine carboxylmethyltransferase family protein [Acidobacteria bacterium]|nr:isoprenylcysteine carboxylmethyltransferase family protein [Acidobacteriota bacterium]